MDLGCTWCFYILKVTELINREIAMRAVDQLNACEVSVCCLKEIIALFESENNAVKVLDEVYNIINTTTYNGVRCLPEDLYNIDFSDLRLALDHCKNMLIAEETRTKKLKSAWMRSRDI